MSLTIKNQGPSGSDHAYLTIEKWSPTEYRISMFYHNTIKALVINRATARDLVAKLQEDLSSVKEESSLSGEL